MNTKSIHLDKNLILIIDDDSMNRHMLKRIFADQYEYEEAENGMEGLEKIEAYQDRICAILLDVSMPVMDGMELLRILNSRGITKVIPVFLITAYSDSDIMQEGYELGVMDFIVKPVNPFVILRRVQNIIELFQGREALSDMVRSQAGILQQNVDTIDSFHKNTIEALASAIEFRDVESGTHTNRIYSVTKYILTNTEFGSGLSENEIENIATASIMHDVGKIAISDIILNKPGKLTADEFDIMKTHTTMGEKLMKQISRNQNHASYKYASDIARHHHERWDGKGYPDGLKGDEISLWAQVVSIADVYDALLTPRVYKKAFEADEAVRMIMDGECGVFNPKLLESFLKVEPELRKWYVVDAKRQNIKQAVVEPWSDEENDSKESASEALLNREIVDVLLLMAAVKYVYDMIVCVNLTRNSYYMIDDERFLKHHTGYDGIFDELILDGASAIPESHSQLFAQTFGRENLLNAYQSGKKSVYLEYPQMAKDGRARQVSTNALFVEDPKTGDIMEISLSRYIDEE